MEQNFTPFSVIMLERGFPVAMWSGSPDRSGHTRVDVYIGDDVNVLGVVEVLLGLAVELLPDEIRPKGIVIRETLKEYIWADDEKRSPF